MRSGAERPAPTRTFRRIRDEIQQSMRLREAARVPLSTASWLPGMADLAEVREQIEHTLTAYEEYAALRRETERLRSEAVICRVSRTEARRLAQRMAGDGVAPA